ncbi:MAG: hypothetical protein WBW81_10650 [Methylocella sp.]
MTNLYRDVSNRQGGKSWSGSALGPPADTRRDGPINDVTIKEMTATIETIQAFAREIAQMSGQALVRTHPSPKRQFFTVL